MAVRAPSSQTLNPLLVAARSKCRYSIVPVFLDIVPMLSRLDVYPPSEFELYQIRKPCAGWNI